MSTWIASRRAVRLPFPPLRPGLVLALGIAIWWLVVIALPASLTSQGQLESVTHYLAGEVFLVGGIACFALGRMLRRPEALRVALGFVLLGLALPALEILTSWTDDGVTVAPQAAVLRGAVLIPVFALLTRRAAIPAGAGRAAVRTLVLIMGIPVVLVVLLGEEATDLYGRHGAERAVAALVELTAMLCWVLLGLQRRRLPGATLGGWGGIGMYLMAGTEFLIVVGLTGILPPIGLIAGVQLAGALTLTLAAIGKLRDAYRGQRAHHSQVSDALVQTSELLLRLEQVQRERLHDARSAVVGVIGASELLATPLPGMSVDAAMLQRLIAAELTRLQGMLDTDVSEPIRDFDVADVFSPVLLAHQIDGARVRVESLAGRAFGRARASATVLDNLLRNARTHAPGAMISVAVDGDDEQIVVVVEDDGPGIPLAERTLVLLPGVRGSTANSRGSGLGLHSCLAAMNAQGGALILGESASGGLRVTLRLPAAATVAQLVAS